MLRTEHSMLGFVWRRFLRLRGDGIFLRLRIFSRLCRDPNRWLSRRRGNCVEVIGQTGQPGQLVAVQSSCRRLF